jgi:hypothetical protein
MHCRQAAMASHLVMVENGVAVPEGRKYGNAQTLGAACLKAPRALSCWRGTSRTATATRKFTMGTMAKSKWRMC